MDNESCSIEELARILDDWGFNLKKKTSEDYKESDVEVMWNSTDKRFKKCVMPNFSLSSTHFPMSTSLTNSPNKKKIKCSSPYK
ncbi:hypothetical protein JTB14_015773 [Gonioctena quinquepunctata]|nr:hypothetical protein JTB14_015773 [Gonioctena quinquepunctata]